MNLLLRQMEDMLVGKRNVERRCRNLAAARASVPDNSLEEFRGFVRPMK